MFTLCDHDNAPPGRATNMVGDESAKDVVWLHSQVT
jgi:hypothetical protein